MQVAQRRCEDDNIPNRISAPENKLSRGWATFAHGGYRLASYSVSPSHQNPRSGVLRGVSGVLRGVSGVFRGVSGVFRGVSLARPAIATGKLLGTAAPSGIEPLSSVAITVRTCPGRNAMLIGLGL